MLLCTVLRDTAGSRARVYTWGGRESQQDSVCGSFQTSYSNGNKRSSAEIVVVHEGCHMSNSQNSFTIKGLLYGIVNKGLLGILAPTPSS